MASRKELLRIEYHYDDDTGMYKVGEIDFGITCELDKYLKVYGRKGKEEIVKTLAYMIYEIETRLRKQEESNPENQPTMGC